MRMLIRMFCLLVIAGSVTGCDSSPDFPFNFVGSWTATAVTVDDVAVKGYDSPSDTLSLQITESQTYEFVAIIHSPCPSDSSRRSVSVQVDGNLDITPVELGNSRARRGRDSSCASVDQRTMIRRSGSIIVPWSPAMVRFHNALPNQRGVLIAWWASSDPDQLQLYIRDEYVTLINQAYGTTFAGELMIEFARQ